MIVMRWTCIGLGVLAFVVAYRVSAGNLLAALGFALTPITLLVSIQRVVETEKERRASAVTEPQFMVQKAGGAKKLRHQAVLIRICSYLLIAIAVPMLILGIGAATQGNLTAFAIALSAAFALYGARIFLKSASKMLAAADGAQ